MATVRTFIWLTLLSAASLLLPDFFHLAWAHLALFPHGAFAIASSKHIYDFWDLLAVLATISLLIRLCGPHILPIPYIFVVLAGVFVFVPFVESIKLVWEELVYCLRYRVKDYVTFGLWWDRGGGDGFVKTVMVCAFNVVVTVVLVSSCYQWIARLRRRWRGIENEACRVAEDQRRKGIRVQQGMSGKRNITESRLGLLEKTAKVAAEDNDITEAEVGAIEEPRETTKVGPETKDRMRDVIGAGTAYEGKKPASIEENSESTEEATKGPPGMPNAVNVAPSVIETPSSSKRHSSNYDVSDRENNSATFDTRLGGDTVELVDPSLAPTSESPYRHPPCNAVPEELESVPYQDMSSISKETHLPEGLRHGPPCQDRHAGTEKHPFQNATPLVPPEFYSQYHAPSREAESRTLQPTVEDEPESMMTDASTPILMTAKRPSAELQTTQPNKKPKRHVTFDEASLWSQGRTTEIPAPVNEGQSATRLATSAARPVSSPSFRQLPSPGSPMRWDAILPSKDARPVANAPAQLLLLRIARRFGLELDRLRMDVDLAELGLLAQEKAAIVRNVSEVMQVCLPSTLLVMHRTAEAAVEVVNMYTELQKVVGEDGEVLDHAQLVLMDLQPLHDDRQTAPAIAILAGLHELFIKRSRVYQEGIALIKGRIEARRFQDHAFKSIEQDVWENADAIAKSHYDMRIKELAILLQEDINRWVYHERNQLQQREAVSAGKPRKVTKHHVRIVEPTESRRRYHDMSEESDDDYSPPVRGRRIPRKTREPRIAKSDPARINGDGDLGAGGQRPSVISRRVEHEVYPRPNGVPDGRGRGSGVTKGGGDQRAPKRGQHGG